MSQRALGTQFDPDRFDPSQVGPAQAKEIAHPSTPGLMPGPEARRMKIQGVQHSLFPVQGHDFMLAPHQQTRQQFADDPRTWWHGRYSEQLPRTGGQRNAGIHVGTFASSDKRRRDLGASKKIKASGGEPGVWGSAYQEWRSFPVRLQGGTSNFPDKPGYDEGSTWSSRRGGVHYYENEIEDAGSISAKVPTRENLLTHSQSVKEARKAGVFVHPHIQWEQQQLGRRDYDPSRQDPRAQSQRIYQRQQEAAGAQHSLFSTAPYNEGRHEAIARRRSLAIDRGVKEYSHYAVQGLG